MKKINIFILIISILNAGVCILNTGCVYAKETLTWQDCVKYALNNHPDLKSALETVSQAKSDTDIATSAALPQIDAQVSGKRSKSSTTGRTANSYEYGVSASQLIFDGLKTASEISYARKTLTAQEYNYLLVSSNIRLDLRNAFIELLKAQELITLTQDIAKRRKQNLDMIKLRYKAGREHKGSLLTAEADLAKAEFEIEQAKRNIVLTQRRLSKELGFDDFNVVDAKGAFLLQNEYDQKPILSFIADNTPFLQELIAKKEAARFNLNSKEADFLPKVYISGSAGRVNDEWPPKNNQWSAGVSVSVPFLEGGSRIAQVLKAKSQVRQAHYDEKSAREGVLVTLESSWNDLKDGIENVEVQKKFLEAAQERAKIANAQYETGLISFNDWIIIEDNLVNAKKSFLNAQANMLEAEAYWVQATGATLEYYYDKE